MSNNRGLSGKGLWGLFILLAGFAMLCGIAALPFYWSSLIDDQLGAARNDLRFIEAKINNAKIAKPPQLTAADDIGPVFISGGTAGLALADLQRRLAQMAEQSGLAITRTQPLQSEGSNGLATLRMEVEATGTIESLRNYLVAIETGAPLIFVNQAQLSAPEGNAASDKSLPSDKLSVVLQLEAYGWWQGGS
jgi:Type II secretion system (T2SS), protein M subtype b